VSLFKVVLTLSENSHPFWNRSHYISRQCTLLSSAVFFRLMEESYNFEYGSLTHCVTTYCSCQNTW